MTYYQIIDRPTSAELRSLGFDTSAKFCYPEINPIQTRHRGLVAVRTGEKRAPKCGEWYLSGAIPEAYKAPNDLTQVFLILKLVAVTTRLVTMMDDSNIVLDKSQNS